jgi:hypothetical protein
MRRTSFAVLSALAVGLAVGLAAGPLAAQNLISQGGWEGFAMRRPDGRFDRCVLYNRTVRALEASPYDMLGITRDADGNIGLMVFFEPRSLSRDVHTSVRMRIDDAAPVTLTGSAVSDFHVVIPGTLDGHTLAAVRDARTIEFSAAAKTVRFAIPDIGAVLERLKSCVDANSR